MNAQVENQAAEQTEVPKLHTEIKAKFNNLVDVKETKFSFRKVKDEVSGVETKRPTVTLPIPAPSVEGIIDIIQNKGGKELDLLLEAVYGVVVDRARDIINEDTKEELNDENFPYAELSWEKIANLPKAERRGGGISKETWEDFAKDYIAVMPGLINKPKESVELAAKVFLTKFATVKADKKVLELLSGYLGLYINNSPNAEQFTECVEFLLKKAEMLLAADTTKLFENL